MTLADMFEGERALVPTTLRGYRMWRAGYVEDEPALISTAHDYSWEIPDGEPAVCMRRELAVTRGLGLPPAEAHVAPVAGCGCGFYAWYDPADIRIVCGDVFGVVEATGSVVMGTHGFRAQKARVLAVSVDGLLPYDLDRYRQVLAASGVDVFRSRIELLTSYPPEDVSGLVDHTCDESCTAQGSVTGRMQAMRQLQASMTAAQWSMYSAIIGGSASVPPPGSRVYPHVFTARRPVPRWKRWPAIALSAFFVLSCTYGSGRHAWDFAGDPNWGDAAWTALNIFLFFVWWHNLGKARRWRWAAR